MYSWKYLTNITINIITCLRKLKIDDCTDNALCQYELCQYKFFLQSSLYVAGGSENIRKVIYWKQFHVKNYNVK